MEITYLQYLLIENGMS